MKNSNKDKESLYLMLLDANILYGWTMSQNLPVNNFKWKKSHPKFDENFIKNYDGNSYKGFIFEIDFEDPKELHELHNDLPFLPKRMKIKKCHKLVCNLYDKKSMLHT